MVALVEEEVLARAPAMRRLLRWCGLVLIGAAAVIQLIRPARTNPPSDPARALAASVALPPDAAHVLARACGDCHSNDTRWPWYSNIAPVSWFVVDHVNHGRRHFNYSDWAKYDREERERLLKNVCTLARKGEMPIASYTWVHREARLSDEDVQALCEWVEGPRARARMCHAGEC
jgi:hypothetical protein